MNEEKKKTEYPIKTFRMSEEVYLSLKNERLAHESWNQLSIRLLDNRKEEGVKETLTRRCLNSGRPIGNHSAT